MKKKEKIYIFDTTLRDGEQSPGASLNTEEKLLVAEQLAKLKVDAIEAGFPIASPGDFEAVKQVAQKIKGPEIAGLCRAVEKDIRRCYDAVKHAAKPRIHTFIATSDIHIKYKLKSSKKKVIEQAVKAVRLAATLVPMVEFSAEDAARTDIPFLLKVVEAVIAAGANVVNLPDTVGYAIPWNFGQTIRTVIEKVPNIDRAYISVHCHNDLGLATANSLAAIAHGARQVECTINGLGERAGNTSLEEIVMILKTRKDLLDFYTDIKTRNIYRTSRLVSKLTGINVQKNKAIVGDNAFSHEAGIHQDGVLKEKTTYEIMKAEDIGWSESRLVLGKHSGRHAFVKRLETLGYGELSRENLEKAFERFKVLADKKKDVYDEDIEAVIEDEIYQIPEKYTIKYLQTSGGTSVIPNATVVLQVAGDGEVTESAAGDGPIDAAIQAINRVVNANVTLKDFRLSAVTSGKDALGEAQITLNTALGDVKGKAVSTDIIEASVRAYLSALNRLMYRQVKQKRRQNLKKK